MLVSRPSRNVRPRPWWVSIRFLEQWGMVRMTAQMNSEVGLLAADLQRRRTERSAARITPNSVFRVPIQVFLDSYDLSVLSGVGTEEELLQAVRANLPGKRSLR
jgi:hypothetical protein